MKDLELRALEISPQSDQASEELPAPLPRADRRVTWLFVMLFLLYMFDYVDRQVVTSLFPFLKADLGLSDTQAGLLVSAVYWSIVVLAFPASILIDRWRGFALAILFFFFARDYRTVKLEERSEKDATVRAMKPLDVFRAFLRTPSLLLTYVAFSGNTLLSTAYLTWLPSYFNRYSNLPIRRVQTSHRQW